MATIKRFEDIGAWQKARILSGEVHNMSIDTRLTKDFRLKDQVNDASGSIMDNIAEGFERGGKSEFIRFLTVAKGSCAEVRSHLYRISDRKYIDATKFNELYNLAEEIASMIGRLINYLNVSEIKGRKFKSRIS